MDDLAIARAGGRAYRAGGLQEDCFAAAQCEAARYGESDDAGSDHDALNVVHVRRQRRFG